MSVSFSPQSVYRVSIDPLDNVSIFTPNGTYLKSNASSTAGLWTDVNVMIDGVCTKINDLAIDQANNSVVFITANGGLYTGQWTINPSTNEMNITSPQPDANNGITQLALLSNGIGYGLDTKTNAIFIRSNSKWTPFYSGKTPTITSIAISPQGWLFGTDKISPASAPGHYQGGNVYQYVAGEWTKPSAQPPVPVTSIAAGKNSLYAIGIDGLLYTSPLAQNTSWSVVPTPKGLRLWHVAVGDTSLWIVGAPTPNVDATGNVLGAQGNLDLLMSTSQQNPTFVNSNWYNQRYPRVVSCSLTPNKEGVMESTYSHGGRGQDGRRCPSIASIYANNQGISWHGQ